MTHTSDLWCEKYRPTTLDDYIIHDNEQRDMLSNWIASGSIPHLLLSGVQGTGKTTLAHILATALNISEFDVLVIEASDENSVDVMREKIKNFVSTYALSSDYKLIILDEADYISQPGQAILRHLIENNSDNVRFILTCNYENKLIAPLKSRLQHLRFKSPDKDDVTELVAGILIREKVDFDLDILDAYVSVGYPDIRHIINTIQQYSSTGSLANQQVTAESNDYKFKLLEYVTKGNWIGARDLICANVIGEEWYDLYKFLYNNVDKSPVFQKNTDNWNQCMVHIAEHAYKHELVAAPEINMTALLIKISMI